MAKFKMQAWSRRGGKAHAQREAIAAAHGETAHECTADGIVIHRPGKAPETVPYRIEGISLGPVMLDSYDPDDAHALGWPLFEWRNDAS